MNEKETRIDSSHSSHTKKIKLYGTILGTVLLGGGALFGISNCNRNDTNQANTTDSSARVHINATPKESSKTDSTGETDKPSDRKSEDTTRKEGESDAARDVYQRFSLVDPVLQPDRNANSSESRDRLSSLQELTQVTAEREKTENQDSAGNDIVGPVEKPTPSPMPAPTPEPTPIPVPEPIPDPTPAPDPTPTPILNTPFSIFSIIGLLIDDDVFFLLSHASRNVAAIASISDLSKCSLIWYADSLTLCIAISLDFLSLSKDLI